MENKTTYPQLFFLFFAGSVAGFFLEGIWRVIRTGAWENHSATVYGPFCIVYGVGAAALYWMSGQVNDIPLWVQFLIYAVTGATVEYLGSFAQERFFGSVSWDYTGRLLSLNGRICLSMTLMWGMLGITFSLMVCPLITQLFTTAADWPVKGLCILLSVLMAADLLLSASALLRWRDRQYDIPPRNLVEERLDERYDDERMGEVYNNMVFLEKTEKDTE